MTYPSPHTDLERIDTGYRMDFMRGTPCAPSPVWLAKYPGDIETLPHGQTWPHRRSVPLGSPIKFMPAPGDLWCDRCRTAYHS